MATPSPKLKARKSVRTPDAPTEAYLGTPCTPCGATEAYLGTPCTPAKSPAKKKNPVPLAASREAKRSLMLREPAASGSPLLGNLRAQLDRVKLHLVNCVQQLACEDRHSRLLVMQATDGAFAFVKGLEDGSALDLTRAGELPRPMRGEGRLHRLLRREVGAPCLEVMRVLLRPKDLMHALCGVSHAAKRLDDAMAGCGGCGNDAMGGGGGGEQASESRAPLLLFGGGGGGAFVPSPSDLAPLLPGAIITCWDNDFGVSVPAVVVPKPSPHFDADPHVVCAVALGCFGMMNLDPLRIFVGLEGMTFARGYHWGDEGFTRVDPETKALYLLRSRLEEVQYNIEQVALPHVATRGVLLGEAERVERNLVWAKKRFVDARVDRELFNKWSANNALFHAAASGVLHNLTVNHAGAGLLMQSLERARLAVWQPQRSGSQLDLWELCPKPGTVLAWKNEHSARLLPCVVTDTPRHEAALGFFNVMTLGTAALVDPGCLQPMLQVKQENEVWSRDPEAVASSLEYMEAETSALYGARKVVEERAFSCKVLQGLIVPRDEVEACEAKCKESLVKFEAAVDAFREARLAAEDRAWSRSVLLSVRTQLYVKAGSGMSLHGFSDAAMRSARAVAPLPPRIEGMRPKCDSD